MASNSGSDNGSGGGLKSLLDELPIDRLKEEVQHGLSTIGEKAVQAAGDKLSDLTDRLEDVAEGGGVVGKATKKGMEEAAEGGSPAKGALKGGLGGVKDKVKEKLGGGGGGGGEKGIKSTNIIEEIDVGVPVDVAYNAWTEFQEWSGFMKKVENVDQEDETKVNFKAQVFWSHREWQGRILEQVPNEKIVWRSKGEKGHVDGAVTFHELAPNLTRILVVLEYYPQGLFERTGNLWRAQGRRARLELKHFRRHVMTEVIQEPDEIEGWRGEIADGEVVRSHDEVVEEEQEQGGDEGEEEPQESGDEPEDEYEGEEEEPEESEEESGDEPEDEYDEGEEEEPEESEEESGDEPEDEYDEGEEEEPEESEESEEEPEDEYDEGEEEEEPEESGDEPEDEYDEGEEEEEEEPEESEPEDEYDEAEEEPDEEEVADEYEEEEPEDEYDEAEEEEPEEERPRRRRRARAS